MFIKTNSHRARETIQRMIEPSEMIDYHYYSDKTGITHIQEISDGFNISKVKGAKVAKKPKEKLYTSIKLTSTVKTGRI